MQTNSKSPVLRTAALKDADRLTALFQASYPLLWQDVYDDRIMQTILPLFCKAQEDLLRSGTFYFAEHSESGDVLGAGGWSKAKPASTETVPGEGHVRHFAVHPATQRQGVGRIIMDATLASAKAQGIHTLHCTSSLSAYRYYEAFGFENLGEITIPVGDIDLPVIEMKWRDGNS